MESRNRLPNDKQSMVNVPDKLSQPNASNKSDETPTPEIPFGRPISSTGGLFGTSLGGSSGGFNNSFDLQSQAQYTKHNPRAGFGRTSYSSVFDSPSEVRSGKPNETCSGQPAARGNPDLTDKTVTDHGSDDTSLDTMLKRLPPISAKYAEYLVQKSVTEMTASLRNTSFFAVLNKINASDASRILALINGAQKSAETRAPRDEPGRQDKGMRGAQQSNVDNGSSRNDEGNGERVNDKSARTPVSISISIGSHNVNINTRDAKANPEQANQQPGGGPVMSMLPVDVINAIPLPSLRLADEELGAYGNWIDAMVERLYRQERGNGPARGEEQQQQQAAQGPDHSHDTAA
ncbi:hypothetical protein F4819DRAFT_488815 [Hypoxylon fuscum]|nr:hypothetical protein F4819DRAFT_488815 [Hypoxylon fuscum]